MAAIFDNNKYSRSVDKAIVDQQRKEAMESKLKSVSDNHTRDLVDRTGHRNLKSLED